MLQVNNRKNNLYLKILLLSLNIHKNYKFKTCSYDFFLRKNFYLFFAGNKIVTLNSNFFFSNFRYSIFNFYIKQVFKFYFKILMRQSIYNILFFNLLITRVVKKFINIDFWFTSWVFFIKRLKYKYIKSKYFILIKKFFFKYRKNAGIKLLINKLILKYRILVRKLKYNNKFRNFYNIRLKFNRLFKYKYKKRIKNRVKRKYINFFLMSRKVVDKIYYVNINTNKSNARLFLYKYNFFFFKFYLLTKFNIFNKKFYFILKNFNTSLQLLKIYRKKFLNFFKSKSYIFLKSFKKKYVRKINNSIIINAYHNKFKFMYLKLYMFFIFNFNKVKNDSILTNFINFHKFKLIFIKVIKRLHKLNIAYKNYYYVCFLRKIRSNMFITITNRVGEVIVSASTGYVHELKKKKKRKSIKSLPFLINFISNKLKKKRIFILWKIYLNSSILRRSVKMIFFEFLKNNIRIKNLSYISNKSHGYPYRLRKVRRI